MVGLVFMPQSSECAAEQVMGRKANVEANLAVDVARGTLLV